MKRLTLFLLVSMLPSIAYCAVAGLNTTVTRTLSDAERFGGCAAELADRPDSAGLGCSSRWVSFSCTGDFASQAAAQRSFDMVQIALLTAAKATIYVDDLKKVNGMCFASRVILSPPE